MVVHQIFLPFLTRRNLPRKATLRRYQTERRAKTHLCQLLYHTSEKERKIKKSEKKKKKENEAKQKSRGVVTSEMF